MAKTKIYPFANGTAYMVFDDYNCARCSKSATNYTEPSPCQLQDALFDAETGDGSISMKVAEGIGLYKDGKRIPLGTVPRCMAFTPAKKKPRN